MFKVKSRYIDKKVYQVYAAQENEANWGDGYYTQFLVYSNHNGWIWIDADGYEPVE